MATDRIQTGLRLNEETYSKLKALSNLEHRSLNNFMEYILQQYLKEYETKNGRIIIPENKKNT